MKTAAVVAFALVVVGSAARADVLPPNAKGVTLSIRVDAQVPAGKLLIIANTFRGADIVKPNGVEPLEWHPLGGSMQIMMVGASEAKGIDEARKSFDRDAFTALKKRASVCGPVFDGVRTLPDTSPADEVRWTWSVTFAGGKCSAKLVSQSFLDKSGNAVDPDGGAPAPANASAATTAPPPPLPAPPPPPAQAVPAPAPAPPPAAPSKSGCGACDVGHAPAGGAPALLLLAPLLWRRRRAARRGPAPSQGTGADRCRTP